MPSPPHAPLDRVFWWLLAGSLLSAAGTFVAPFLAVYLTGRGLPPARVGLLVSCFGLGALVAGPPAGHLADALGRRGTLLVALLGSACGAALLALVRSPWAIAGAVLLFGSALAASRPPLRAIVADVVPVAEVPRAFGWLYWAENVGASASMLAGGVLAAGGWALPFLADAGTTLAFALVVLLRIPETLPPRAATAPGRPAPADGAGFAPVLRDPAALGLLGLVLATNLVYAQSMVSLPIQMTREGYSPAVFGAVGACSALLVVFLQPLSARLLAWISPAQALAAGALLVGLGVGAYALCGSAVAYGLATCVWTLGEILFYATASAQVAALAPPEARGRYMAAYGLCLSAGSAAAPLVGPAVLGALGGRTLWTGSLLVAAATAAGFLAWGRRGARAGAPGRRALPG